jgi:hypothetical protein
MSRWISLRTGHLRVSDWLGYVPELTVAWVIVRNQSTPFISIPIDDEMNARFDMVG